MAKKIIEIGLQQDGSFNNLNEQLKQTVESSKSLKAQYRELIQELATLDESSDAFRQASLKAAELKDQIGDINARVSVLSDDSFKLNGFISVAEGIAGGFTTAVGALQIFGGENEKVEKALQKIGSALAVLNGIQSIANVLQKESTLTLFLQNTVLKSNTLATIAAAAAESKFTAIKWLGVAAQRALNSAMAASGLGALIVLLGIAAGAWYALSDSVDENTESVEDNTAAKDRNNESQERWNQIHKRAIDLEKEYLEVQRQTAEMEAEIAVERAKRTETLLDDKEAEIALAEEAIKTAEKELDYVRRLNKEDAATIGAQAGGKDILKNRETAAVLKLEKALTALTEVQKKYNKEKEKEQKLVEWDQQIFNDQMFAIYTKEREDFINDLNKQNDDLDLAFKTGTISQEEYVNAKRDLAEQENNINENYAQKAGEYLDTILGFSDDINKKRQTIQTTIDKIKIDSANKEIDADLKVLEFRKQLLQNQYTEIDQLYQKEIVLADLYGQEQRSFKFQLERIQVEYQYWEAQKQNTIDQQELFDIQQRQRELGLQYTIITEMKKRQVIDATLETINQSVAFATQLVEIGIQAANDRLNEQIAFIEEQIDYLETVQDQIDQRIEDSTNRQNDLESQLENARGLRRERLLEGIAQEKAAQEKLAKDQVKIEQDKQKKLAEIEKKKRDQEKLAAQSSLIQAAGQAALSVAAIAAQSAKQDFTFGVATIAAIGSVLASVTAAIVAAKNLSKFEKGGIVDGPSHREGGVKAIVGGSNMIELEGRELIVNKGIWSRPDWVKTISEMNAQTGGKRFFETGGIANANFNTINESLTKNTISPEAILLANRPIITSIVDIDNARARTNKIVENVKI